ncbi:FMN-binding protein [bacterium]|nr:FMN-binding protein [bacterium]
MKKNPAKCPIRGRWLLAFSLAIVLGSCTITPVDYTAKLAALPKFDIKSFSDGEYAGKAFLFPVKVKLDLTIAGGALRRIAIREHFNGRGKPAESIVASVLETQSVQVEAISGATHSSVVILQAISDALKSGAH